MKEDFGLDGKWLFFATSHRKGAVDGVGGATKRAVWSQVKLRKALIECASDFLECAQSVVQKVHFLLLKPSQIEDNKEMLNKLGSCEKNTWDSRQTFLSGL